MVIDQFTGNQKIREHNQKDAPTTSKTTNSIRDIPLFRWPHHAGKIHTGLPPDSHGQFSKNTNRRWRGILDLRSGPRSQELELETVAASWAAMTKTGSRWFCREGHPWRAPWKEAGMRVPGSIWWEGIAERGPQKAIWRWFWERGGRVGGLIGTAEPFSDWFPFWIWDFDLRWRDGWIFGLGGKMGIRIGRVVFEIHIISVTSLISLFVKEQFLIFVIRLNQVNV